MLESGRRPLFFIFQAYAGQKTAGQAFRAAPDSSIISAEPDDKIPAC